VRGERIFAYLAKVLFLSVCGHRQRTTKFSVKTKMKEKSLEEKSEADKKRTIKLMMDKLK